MRLRTITESDKIPGGLAKGMPDSAFDQTQLHNGIKVELEHTTDHDIAKEIAKDHLKEDPEYYIKLRKMENKAITKRMSREEKMEIVLAAAQNAWDTNGNLDEKRSVARESVVGLTADLDCSEDDLKEMIALAEESV